MRYDTPIYFQTVIEGAYDQVTGNYDDDAIIEEEKMASVIDTSTKMMQIVYGAIKRGSLTIHIQNHYVSAFNFIRVNNTRYKVDYSRALSTKHVFVVSEV